MMVTSKRAGSAFEVRPASQARCAAHPQERQRSAAEGERGTECARPGLSVHAALAPRPRREIDEPQCNRRHETVPQSVPVSVLISAKYWSEWQDLNLRPPRP